MKKVLQLLLEKSYYFLLLLAIVGYFLNDVSYVALNIGLFIYFGLVDKIKSKLQIGNVNINKYQYFSKNLVMRPAIDKKSGEHVGILYYNESKESQVVVLEPSVILYSSMEELEELEKDYQFLND